MKIYFSSKAEVILLELCDYLRMEYNERVLDKFLAKLDSKLNLISNQPFASPKSFIIDSLYKCVVTKQVSLYYRVDIKNNEIEIITLFDSRQNPITLIDDSSELDID